MKGWKDHILEDVVENFVDYRGKTPKKTDSGIPLITAKIVKSGRLLEPTEFISESDYPLWMTRGYPATNDVVLTTEAPLGEVALIKNPTVALGQRIITLQTKKDKCDSIFLKYYFQSIYGQAALHARASGSTVQGIKSALLKKINVLLPPLPEQRAIAGVLSSLDDKIDLLHRQNRTLEAMAETLFRQWFVEEADEGWGEVELSFYADNIRENVQTQNLQQYQHYVGLEHIPRKHIVLETWGTTESIGSNKTFFKEGDILFGKLRPYFHKVVFAPVNGVCSTDIMVIRPKKKEWFPFCLLWFFQDAVIEHSNIGSNGTRMPRTNWEITGGFMVPKASEDKIEEFNVSTKPVFDKMVKNISQISALERLRDTLLPKLMSGEVRIGV